MTPINLSALICVLAISVATLYALPVNPNSSHDNARTRDSLSIVAGSLLFNSTMLSSDGRLSCSSCHPPDVAFQDAYERALSRSLILTRNTPTLLNVRHYTSFFWDGRATSLKEQITGPLFNRLELGSNDSILHKAVLEDKKLRYIFYILKYPSDSVRDFVVNSLARFLESIGTNNTWFHLSLEDIVQLTQEERHGRDLFFGKAACSQCHQWPNLTHNSFHEIGLSRQRIILETYSDGGKERSRLGYDYGRGNIAPGKANLFKFRTPSLFNVALTSPYMHNGSIATLAGVLDFYARGGDIEGSETHPIDLTREEKAAIVAFLCTLSDVRYLTRP